MADSFVRPLVGAAMLLAAAAFVGATARLAGAVEDSRFGHKLLPHFLLRENYTNLNHGSYGAPPRLVLEAEHAWQVQMELNPDYWFRYDTPDSLFGALDSVRQRLAERIGAVAEDVVFVDGASGGVNAVLRSIVLKENEKILYLNTAYQMVKNTINYVHNHDGREASLQVDIRIPSTTEDMVSAVERALKSDPSVRLASFSHITSTPAIVLPVKELTALCHRYNVLVLIDGAHALGQIPVNVTDLGADFYVANGHKWLYAPKGSGLLWVTRQHQSLIFPNVISFEGVGTTDFQRNFAYTGTKDYSAFLAMGAALDFRDQVLGGDSGIMKYMHDLAQRGGDLLARHWQTEILDPNRFAALVDVRLPESALHCCDLMGLSDILLREAGTYVPVYKWDRHCYARVSAQVYNDISDFEMLGTAVTQILATGCNSSQTSIFA